MVFFPKRSSFQSVPCEGIDAKARNDLGTIVSFEGGAKLNYRSGEGRLLLDFTSEIAPHKQFVLVVKLPPVLCFEGSKEPMSDSSFKGVRSDIEEAVLACFFGQVRFVIEN